MEARKIIKEILIKRQDKQYQKELKRKKVNYAVWVRQVEKASNISNRRQEKPQEFLLWVQKKGSISKEAYQKINTFFVRHPHVMIVYGDEDIQQVGKPREMPWYKPQWSPDTYLSYFYLGSVIAVRKELVQKAGIIEIKKEINKGTNIIFFEKASELRPYITKLIVLAGGFEKGCRQIARIPYILFHASRQQVWKEYLQCTSAEEQKIEKKEKKISVVIPSKDNPKVLSVCLNSLVQCDKKREDRNEDKKEEEEKSREESKEGENKKEGSKEEKSREGENRKEEKNKEGKESELEIIVVDNGSSPQNRAEIEKIVKKEKNGIYLYQPMEFNFSHMCNLGAKKATGEILFFLNDDIEMQGYRWIEEMQKKAEKPYVGAVGLKLYYPNSKKIQHVGITNLGVGPVHKLQFLEDNKSYYFGKNRYQQNCLAVTGACLMVEKKKFWEAGGFEESLKVAYNDVDFCFTLYENGYQNVVINSEYAFHHESFSRGSDETREQQARLLKERKLLYHRHPALEKKDPYYPSQLNIQGLDNRIVPGYYNAYNTIQEGKWHPFYKDNQKIREDNCLMVRVETSGPDKIQGYSIVLGDNNACYENFLVLQRLEKGKQESPLSFFIKVQKQYRQDLEENVPDQKNAAMGGFCISRKEENLPEGSYRIGLLAVNKVTKLKLINWSGKYLEVESRGKNTKKIPSKFH